MISHKIALIIVLLFPVSELVIGVSKRASQKDLSVQDQGSLRLIIVVIVASIAAGFGLKNVHITRLPVPS